MERILDITTITPKYQITITKAVRERFNFKAGDRLLLIEKDGELIIRKV